MQKQRVIIQAIFSLLLAFGLMSSADVRAEEKATKEECVAKCQQAAQMVKDVGVEETMKTIMDPNGPFIWKDTYVFCFDMETGIMLAHPQAPKLVGKVTKGVKDKTGKLLFVEYANIAKTAGEGWVSYVWPKPGEEKESPKISYVYRVPNENLVMVAGIYED